MVTVRLRFSNTCYGRQANSPANLEKLSLRPVAAEEKSAATGRTYRRDQ